MLLIKFLVDSASSASFTKLRLIVSRERNCRDQFSIQYHIEDQIRLSVEEI